MPHNRLPLLALLLLAPTAAQQPLAAQEIIPFAGGGVALASGDHGGDTDQGWFALGGFDVPLPTLLAREASLRTSVAHARLPFAEGFGDEMQITSVSVEMGYHFGPASRLVRPYLRGGVSMNVHRYEPGDLRAPSTTEVHPGGVAGAGLNVMFGPTDLVLGAHFTSGVDSGFLGFHGGLALPLR